MEEQKVKEGAGSREAAWPLAAGVMAGLVAAVLLAPLPFGPLDGARWGVSWSDLAVPAAVLQLQALDALTRTLLLLAAGTCLLGLGTMAILVTATSSRRRHEMAVRGALGERGRSLARRLLADTARPLAVAGLVRGVLLGAAAGVILRLSWPMEGARGPGAELLPAALAALGAVGVAAAGVTLVALLPLRHGVRDLAASLATGGRASPDPREGGLRRILVTFQLTASMALLCGALLAVRAAPGARTEKSPDAPAAFLVPLELGPANGDPGEAAAERQEAVAALLQRMAALPTLRSESIADPGAWAGVGPRDVVLAQCGNCIRGMMPTPILAGVLDHHVAAAGFFAQAGMEVTSGRDFGPRDRPGAEPVAVVTRDFARTHFEGGDPLGRKVRVGAGWDDWYTVVGVVEPLATEGIGVHSPPAPAVYLSALQHPPRSAMLSLELAEGDAHDVLDQVLSGLEGLPGVARAGNAVSVAEHRSAAAAPLRWTGRVALALGAVALLLSLLGARRVARIEVRARERELGTRMALGADGRRVVRYILGRSLRMCLAATALALPLVTALTAHLRSVVGDVPLFEPVPFLVLASLVTAAAVLGALEPARRAAGADPAVVLSGE